MRSLLVLVIAMGVLIVAGLAVIGITVAHRLTHIAMPEGPPPSAVLDEPAGTQIVGVTALGERLAITLHGGGPDRVMILDAGAGRTLGEVRLAK